MTGIIAWRCTAPGMDPKHHGQLVDAAWSNGEATIEEYRISGWSIVPLGAYGELTDDVPPAIVEAVGTMVASCVDFMRSIDPTVGGALIETYKRHARSTDVAVRTISMATLDKLGIPYTDG